MKDVMTEADRRKAYIMYRMGVKVTDLARQFGVSQPAISKLVRKYDNGLKFYLELDKEIQIAMKKMNKAIEVAVNKTGDEQ